MKHRLGYVGMLFALVSLTAQAFIYEARVLRKWDAQNNRYNYFIGLSDFHDHSHEVTPFQRTFLEQAIANSCKKTVKLIVEDLSSPGVGGKFSCGRFYLGPKGGILSGLSSHCIQHALDVDNVEYRYCRVIALGPFMDTIQAACTQSCDAPISSTVTLISMLLHEVKDLINEVKTYNDGPIANKYYVHCLRDIAAHSKKLLLEQSCSMSVADYARTHLIGTDREEKLKHLFTFDSGLVDAKMLHTVLTTNNKEKIIAIAGGTHIGVVSQLLEKCGYEVVYTSPIKKNNQSISNSLSASSSGKQKKVALPDAIDLSILKNYW